MKCVESPAAAVHAIHQSYITRMESPQPQQSSCMHNGHTPVLLASTSCRSSAGLQVDDAPESKPGQAGGRTGDASLEPAAGAASPPGPPMHSASGSTDAAVHTQAVSSRPRHSCTGCVCPKCALLGPVPPVLRSTRQRSASPARRTVSRTETLAQPTRFPSVLQAWKRRWTCPCRPSATSPRRWASRRRHRDDHHIGSSVSFSARRRFGIPYSMDVRMQPPLAAIDACIACSFDCAAKRLSGGTTSVTEA